MNELIKHVREVICLSMQPHLGRVLDSYYDLKCYSSKEGSMQNHPKLFGN